MKFAGAREAEPRRLMCGVPVRHPELAAAPGNAGKGLSSLWDYYSMFHIGLRIH